MSLRAAVYTSSIQTAARVLSILLGVVSLGLLVRNYGTAVSGYLATVGQIAMFMDLMDGGIALSVMNRLYPVLLSGERMVLASHVRWYKRLSRWIALIAALAGAVAALRMGLSEAVPFSSYYATFLAFAVLAGPIFFYFGFYPYGLVFNADNKGYRVALPFAILDVIGQSATIYIYYRSGSLMIAQTIIFSLFVVRNLYVTKLYHQEYDSAVPVAKAPPVNPNIALGFGAFNRLANLVVANTDIIIVSLFSPFSTTGVYAVFSYMMNYARIMFLTVFVPVQALFGAALHSESKGESAAEGLYAYASSVLLMAGTAMYLISVFGGDVARLVFGLSEYPTLYAPLVGTATWLVCVRTGLDIVIQGSRWYGKNTVILVAELVLYALLAPIAARFGGVPLMLTAIVLVGTMRVLMTAWFVTRNVVPTSMGGALLLLISQLTVFAISVISVYAVVYLADLHNLVQRLTLGAFAFPIAVLGSYALNRNGYGRMLALLRPIARPNLR